MVAFFGFLGNVFALGVLIFGLILAKKHYDKTRDLAGAIVKGGMVLLIALLVFLGMSVFAIFG